MIIISTVDMNKKNNIFIIIKNMGSGLSNFPQKNPFNKKKTHMG